VAAPSRRKHLSKGTRVEGWKHTFPAAPAGALPSTVFEEDHTLHVNGATLALKHYSPAHTDSDGTIRAAEANLAKVTDKMIVIPGHGDVGAKADLKLFRDVMVDLREKVAALKKQGRSLAEVIAAKPGARTDDEWGNGFMTPALFLEWVYQGV
jgi:hypothetical protein